MAGHEWEDWFEREEFIGQISDIRVQNLQVEREVVQKRTFTRWMNLHLEKCNPPLEVHDLFRDIQDGRILMALLEELSGCRLLHTWKPSSHRIFRINNIAKVLTFLEERNVKLVSIDAADVADGNSSIVLGLTWNIILFFQIKELTGNIRNQFPSSSSLSSIPTSSDSDTSHSSTPSDERRPSIAARDHGKAIKTLLQWVQRRTRKYGVAVQDFGKSWASGLAFLAVIKSIDPSLVDMRRALLRSSRENIEDAFRTAHYSLGIPRLLEPEDVTLDPPDEQSVMTYVSQFLEHFPGIEEDESLDFLERSKVSARMNEPPVRNGVQRKREKSYVVKRDWVQPPPKIFISSVTEERAQTHSPAQPRTPEDRPIKETLEGSSPSTTDNQPLCRPLGLNKDTGSALNSPQPSLIDSAVNSPDSWGENLTETAPQLQQSCSDSSLTDLRYSASGELTSEQGSPLASEGVSQDQVDTDLFIDEGNFSLSSMESFPAKPMMLSEEEDAYRYILDIKEDESSNHVPDEGIMNDPNAQERETSLVQNPETVKPASHEPSYGDSDSGYYPGHKDISTADADEVSKSSLLTDTDDQVSGIENVTESQSEFYKQSLESSISEDFQKLPNESNPMAFFEDDPECPVLKYERISISGSEEDVEAELSEETPLDEEVNMPDVFNSDTRPYEDSKEELVYLKEAEEVGQVFLLDQDQECVLDQLEDDVKTKDEADSELELPQIPTDSSPSGSAEPEAEIQEEDKAPGNKESGMCEEPVINDLSEASLHPANSLAEINFIEVTSSADQLSEVQEVGSKEAVDEEPCQDNVSPAVNEGNLKDELNVTSCLENEVRTKIMHEDVTTDESKLELDQQSKKDEEDDDESKLEEETFSLHVNLEGQHIEMLGLNDEETTRDQHHANASEAPELSESNDMQQSDIPHSDVPPSEVSEALEESIPNLTFDEESKHSFTTAKPSSPASQPDWDQGVVNQPCSEKGQGEATWDETERIIGTPERVEKFPAELRLSLSVTPLQPAPSQLSPTDSERALQEKVVESPEQSPFELWSRHPGEWGAVDSDLHTDHCELISSDEELSANTASTATATDTTARENTETLREEAASVCAEDKSLPSTTFSIQEPFDTKDCEKTENGESTDAIMMENVPEWKEISSREGSESSSEVTLSEIYLLLLMWLLVYCLFVLPQMDIWTIPSLLLNLE